MIKNDLAEYVNIQKEIKQIQDEIERIKSKVMFPGTRIISDMPKAPTKEFDQIGNVIAQVEDLENQYKNKLGLLFEKQIDLELKIDNLPARERQLIRYRYISKMEWKDIVKKMGYSYQQLHRIHNIALKLLDEKDETS